jgi:hypothetical protein
MDRSVYYTSFSKPGEPDKLPRWMPVFPPIITTITTTKSHHRPRPPETISPGNDDFPVENKIVPMITLYP